MRRARLAVLSAALLLAAAGMPPAAGAAAGQVLTIKGSKQFAEALAAHPFLVAEKLAPEYKKAATELAGHDPPITLAVLDATDKANHELKEKYGIKNFPTLKVFRGGDGEVAAEYKGPRDAAGIVRPPTSQLTSAEAVAEATAGGEAVVLAHFVDASSPELKHYQDVASALRDDIDFYWVSDPVLLHHCTDRDCRAPFVVMHLAGEPEAPVYEGAFEPGLLRTWAQSHSTPLVVRFGEAAHQKHESEELAGLVREAAAANDGLKFVLAPPTKESKRLLDHYSLAGADLPAFLIDDIPTASKYLRTRAKPADLPEFLKEFKDGALTKHIKSEPPPKDNSGPVKIVTANTFDEMVFSDKKLAPVWEALGKEFAGDDDVVIAKMDGTGGCV
eukprot:scaffold4.g4768.t1